MVGAEPKAQDLAHGVTCDVPVRAECSAAGIAGKINKKITPRREAYPSSAKNSDDWGTLAWSYPVKGLNAARERIERILVNRRSPKPEDIQQEVIARADDVRVRVLPPVVQANGDNYRQLKRSGQVAIYKADRLSTFEVIWIDSGPPHPFDERKDQYDLVERYPSSELWGQAGWSWQSLALAEAHFKFILRRGREKKFHGSAEFYAALKS